MGRIFKWNLKCIYWDRTIYILPTTCYIHCHQIIIPLMPNLKVFMLIDSLANSIIYCCWFLPKDALRVLFIHEISLLLPAKQAAHLPLPLGWHTRVSATSAVAAAAAVAFVPFTSELRPRPKATNCRHTHTPSRACASFGVSFIHSTCGSIHIRSAASVLSQALLRLLHQIATRICCCCGCCCLWLQSASAAPQLEHIFHLITCSDS